MKFSTESEIKLTWFKDIYEQVEYRNENETVFNCVLEGENKNLASKIRKIRKLQGEYQVAKSEEKAGFKKAKNKLKASLPAIEVSIDRANKNQHTGLLQVDIDGKDNPLIPLEKMRALIIDLPFVHRAFISPSGDGYKALIRIPASNDTHGQAHLTVKQIFIELGLVIDDKTKNINRRCYISLDKNHYYKPFIETAEMKIQGILSIEEKPGKAIAPSTNMEFLKGALQAISSKKPRPDYDEWLKIASGAYNSFGDDGYSLVEEVFPSEAQEYIEKKGNLLKDVTVGTIFHFAKTWADWKLPPEAVAEHKQLLLEKQLSSDSAFFDKKLSGLPEVLQTVAKSVKPLSMFFLAKEYLRIDLVNNEGRERNPTAKEAVVIIAEHFKNNCDVHNSGISIIDNRLHVFVENHWQYLDDSELSRVLGVFAECLGHTVSDSRHYRIRSEYVKQLYNDSPMLKQESGKILVNFSNGTLHIDSASETLRPHRKQDGITYVLPFEYSQKAKAPLFSKYLKRVLPDGECRVLLMEFFGWIFIRDLKLEKILILLGDGENGKSVFFDVITNLLGVKNVSQVSCESLRKPESRSLMVGKLLNYGSELSGNVSPDLWKKLASGEPVEFRYLFENLFITDNYSRLAYNANTLPSEVEHTHGYFRRYMIIPFEQVITKEEKDPDLARKIIANELSGVMNMILVGMRSLRQSRKFSSCIKSDEYLEKHKKASDSVAQFIEEEEYKSSQSQKIMKGDLYKIYKLYCGDSGFRYVSKRKFGERLLKLDFKEGRISQGRFWFIYKTNEHDPFGDAENFSDLM